MGALKIVPIPEPIPTATAILLSESLRCNRSAKAEPIPADICAVGPSLPALPPDPIVIADATVLTTGILLFISPLLLWKASIAASVPCPSPLEQNYILSVLRQVLRLLWKWV